MVTNVVRESASALSRRARRVVLSTGLVAAMALVLAAAPALAAEEFGIEPGSFAVGATSTQAGAHDDFTTAFKFNTDSEGLPVDNVKDIVVDLPPGIVGNPTTAPKCFASQLAPGGDFSCPPDSQVGRVDLNFLLYGFVFKTSFPVWNMAQRGVKPAEFGFKVVQPAIFASVGVRPDDYGLRTVIANIPTTFPLVSSSLTLWGNPPDSSHDSGRGLNCYFIETELSCAGEPRASGQSPAAFMRNSTECGVQHTATVTVDSWQDPSSKIALSASPAPMTGCDRLSFDPDMSLRAGTRSAGEPTGVTVDLTVPQSDNPGDLGTPDLKKAVVTLPPGMTINAAATDGQQGCAPAQIGIGSNDPPTCPDSSRLGTVKIKTPVLEEELEGGVYLAKQKENPFGSLLALYMAVKGPGFYLKLPGRIDLDQASGQITTTFENTPQLPFERLRLSLRGGTRAPLITPGACGTYSTKAVLTSWSSSTPVELESPFKIDQGCSDGGGFSPGLQAGTSNPSGGSFSPFTLRVTRGDGQQNISSIEAKLPAGLLAKLAGIPPCGDQQAATGNCPASSQVGITTIGVGSGTNPVYVPEAGKAPTAVYLAGPYKGAPYSLVVMVPAQAGPFDLGTVVVRNALYVDPETTQVTTKSDPLPQILQGIPVGYRDIRVEINRPEFTVNPTSCAPMSVVTTIGGSGGATAHPSAPFEAANCERLGFEPKLALKFSGKTHRSAFPRLKATMSMPKVGANVSKAVVLMPKTELLEQGHIRTVCTREQWAADSCPKGSIYGKAKAWTPLLDKPLQGNVYLRSNGGARELPDLVADLKGAIDIELVGYIDAVNARLRARFLNVPDAPVSKFMLDMQGGKKGLLVHNTDVCKTKPVASAKFSGQNGKVRDLNPVVKVACGKKK